MDVWRFREIFHLSIEKKILRRYWNQSISTFHILSSPWHAIKAKDVNVYQYDEFNICCIDYF